MRAAVESIDGAGVARALVAGLRAGDATVTATVGEGVTSVSHEAGVSVSRSGMSDWPIGLAIGESVIVDVLADGGVSPEITGWSPEDPAVVGVASRGASGRLLGRSVGAGAVLVGVLVPGFAHVDVRIPLEVSALRLDLIGDWTEAKVGRESVLEAHPLGAGGARLSLPLSARSSNVDRLDVSAQDSAFIVRGISRGAADLLVTVGGDSIPRQDFAFALPVREEGEWVTAGLLHTCGLVTGGEPFCWGNNFDGQLGDGTRRNARVTPVPVAGALEFSVIEAGGVAVGTFGVMVSHTCGLSTGNVYCWGANASEQLAGAQNCTLFDCDVATPVEIRAGGGVGRLEVGGRFTCVIATTFISFNGKECWGGTPPYLRAPSGGTIGQWLGRTGPGEHECSLDGNSGILSCSGLNSNGQLGDGSTTDQFSGSAIDVPGLSVSIGGTPPSRRLLVATGGAHTCAIEAVTDRLLCWGANDSNQIGPIAPDLCPSGPCSRSPIEVPFSGTLETMSAGSAHTCALTVQGEVYCWGSGEDGQLGDGEATSSPLPRLVSHHRPFLRIAAGGTHTCAVDAAREIYCWGSNSTGQLGRDPAELFGSSATPVRIRDPRPSG